MRPRWVTCFVLWASLFYVPGETKSNQISENSCAICEHGVCVDGNCECNSCWTGSGCNVSANSPPQFTQNVYEFTLPATNLNDTTVVLGYVNATDPDNSSHPCGQLRFELSSPSELPTITVDKLTGAVFLNVDESHLSHSTNVTVVVRNGAPFDQATDSASLLLKPLEENQYTGSLNHPLLKNNTEFLRIRKRQISVAPTELEFEMIKLSNPDNDELCAGCFCMMKLIVRLPEGTVQPIIELFGPESESSFKGYVSEPVISKRGAAIPPSLTMSPNPLRNQGGQPVHMALNFNSVTIPNAPGTSIDDYSFEITYKTGLFPTNEAGIKVTSGAGAHLNEVLWIGVVNLQTIDSPPPEVTIQNCPSTALYPGSIYKLVLDIFAPFASGNYAFQIVDPSSAISILDGFVVPGKGFEQHPGTVNKVRFLKTDSWLARTDRFEITISDSQNEFASDGTKSKEERGFKIELYTQVSPRPGSRARLDLRALLPTGIIQNSVCEFDISFDTQGFTKSVSPSITVDMDANSADTLKTVDALINVVFPANSKQSYYLHAKMLPPYKAEFGVARVESSGAHPSHIKPGIPLSMDHMRSGQNNEVILVKIYLGVVENTESTTSAHTVFIRLTIKVSGAADVVSGDTVKFEVTPYWSTGSGSSVQSSFTVGSVTVITAPDGGNLPVVTFAKLQPDPSNPEANYPAVLQLKTTFADSFVYSPLKFEVKTKDVTSTIKSVRIESVGDCLRDLVPVGVLMALDEHMVKFQLNSVYATCNAQLTNRDFVMQIVVDSESSGQADLEAILTVNQKVLTKSLQFQIAPNTDSSPLAPEKQPLLDVQLANSASLQIPNTGLNFLLARLSIMPSAKQSYRLSVSTPSDSLFEFCQPKLVSSSHLLGLVSPEEATVSPGSLVLQPQNLLYETAAEQLDASLDSLAYLIPVVTEGTVDTTATVSVIVTHGTANLIADLKPVLKAAPTATNVPNTFGVFRLDTLDFSSRSEKESESDVAPGETVRLAYDIYIPQPKCATFLVTIEVSPQTNWPVDLGGAYLQSHGDGVWCLQPWIQATPTKDETEDPPHIKELNLNLGKICSQGRNDSAVRIAIFARPWTKNFPDTTAESLGTVSIGINMKENDILDPNSEKSVVFNVNNANTLMEQQTIFSKELVIAFQGIGTAYSEPGVISSLTLAIEVPAGSISPSSNIHVECPKSADETEARCTIVDATITSGFNLAELQNEKFLPTFTSSVPSKQFNVMDLSLGNVVNTGATHSMGVSIPDADKLSVTIDVRLADDKDANNGASVPITAEVTLGSRKSQASTVIQVNREGTEEMLIDLTAQIPNDAENQTTYGPGEKIKLSVLIVMNENSKLECQQQKLIVHLLSIFEDVTILQQTDGINFVKETIDSDPRIAQFSAGPLHFDMSAEVLLSLTVAQQPNLPNRNSVYETSITVELVCMAHERTNPKPQNLGGRPARFYALTKATVKAMVPDTTDGEFNMRDTLQIRDCQITAFTSPDPSYSIAMIRPSSGRGWKIPARHGTFSHYRYMTLMFGSLTTLQSLKFELLDPSNKVLKIAIYATNDGRSFFLHEEGMVQYSSSSSGTYPLKHVLSARGIRVVFKELEHDQKTSIITMDFSGTTTSKDVGTFDPCRISPYTMAPLGGYLPVPFTVEPRTVLFGNDKLFYCDLWPTIHKPFEDSKRCYMIGSDPTITLRDMGPMVSQILTYMPTKHTILGIGYESQSLVYSPDDGQTWRGINKQFYLHVTSGSTDMINATVIPWTTIDGQFDDQTTGPACTHYSSGNWHICFNGIYYQNDKVVDWNSQCSNFDPFSLIP